jgi:uncharacterized membrane protein
VGGVFYAFSTFVMRAFARLPAAEGIRAMQSINVTVITPLFMLAFLGTGIACLAVAGLQPFAWESRAGLLRIAGCLLYVIGTIGVTMVCNVPRNNALDALDPASLGAAEAWSRYLAEWVLWNHVRTAAAILASVLLLVGR